jgi:arylsulfatase A-like enzyme
LLVGVGDAKLVPGGTTRMTRIDRFRFRRLAWSVLPAIACLLQQGTARADDPAAAARPNFLFIYTDDQRWDALSVVQREQGERARFPWIESPNLDRLAAEGVRFRNAFVVTSLCAPSRAAFLTGRYGHLNGIVDNHTPFSEASVTHASLLRAAGYRTGYIGKWHMGSQSGQRPGFDFSASFIGQGKYFDCPVEVNGKETPSSGWVDDVSTDYALKFLEENKQQPFALVLGFKTCHGPFEPPPRTAEAYSGAEARPVPNLQSPAIYLDPDRKSQFGKGASAQKTQPNLGYFRGLRAIDDNVGKLMQKLDALGLAENTMVIYSSDNGYYQSEHGLADKRTAYEESMRIPLLLRYPKLPVRGVTVDRMVLNIDLAPTLLDFAGLKVPAEMQGRSWRPLLAGSSPPADWRTSFFYSYFREGRSAAPTVNAVRTESAKLIKYPGHDDWTELFDLDRDPYEQHNLIGDASATDLRQQLEQEYDLQAKTVAYVVPDFADEKRLPPAPQPLKAWVLDYQAKRSEAKSILDASTYKNNGALTGVKLGETSDGAKAWLFDGRGSIDVPKSASLDPSSGPFAWQVTLTSTADSGVVLARGGATRGYCLYLADGRPTFVYQSPSGKTLLAGAGSITGRRTTIIVRVTASKRIVLEVDGQQVAQRKIANFIEQDPSDRLSIGADSGSKVVETSPPGFQGTIESVKLYSGELASE